MKSTPVLHQARGGLRILDQRCDDADLVLVRVRHELAQFGTVSRPACDGPTYFEATFR
jgi:hypothetical protein